MNFTYYEGPRSEAFCIPLTFGPLEIFIINQGKNQCDAFYLFIFHQESITPDWKLLSEYWMLKTHDANVLYSTNYRIMQFHLLLLQCSNMVGGFLGSIDITFSWVFFVCAGVIRTCNFHTVLADKMTLSNFRPVVLFSNE